MKLRGIETAVQKLQATFRATGEAIELGLYAGGLIIEKDSLRRTPKDTGHLRNSIYTNAVGKRKVEVGYTAEYAAAVHENLSPSHGIPRGGNKRGTFWDVGEPKFLEKAAHEKEQEALQAVQDAITAAIEN